MSVSVTEPIFTAKLSNKQLKEVKQRKLRLLPFLCHIQSVEWSLKMVTEASREVLWLEQRAWWPYTGRNGIAPAYPTVEHQKWLETLKEVLDLTQPAKGRQFWLLFFSRYFFLTCSVLLYMCTAFGHASLWNKIVIQYDLLLQSICEFCHKISRVITVSLVCISTLPPV